MSADDWFVCTVLMAWGAISLIRCVGVATYSKLRDDWSWKDGPEPYFVAIFWPIGAAGTILWATVYMPLFVGLPMGLAWLIEDGPKRLGAWREARARRLAQRNFLRAPSPKPNQQPEAPFREPRCPHCQKPYGGGAA